jgi:putative MFS transporter
LTLTGVASPAAPLPLGSAIGAAIDAIHTPRTRYFAPILLGLILLFDSWDAAVIAYVMPSLAKAWGLTPIVMGSILSAGYAGQFIGAILLGAMAERYGRLRVFVPSAALMALLALVCAAASGVWMLSAARFTQGIFVGGALPVASAYINEIAPTRTRGRFVGVFQTVAILGYSCASFSSMLIVPWLGWRWMFALGALPLLALPLLPWHCRNRRAGWRDLPIVPS